MGNILAFMMTAFGFYAYSRRTANTMKTVVVD